MSSRAKDTVNYIPENDWGVDPKDGRKFRSCHDRITTLYPPKRKPDESTVTAADMTGVRDYIKSRTDPGRWSLDGGLL